MRDSEERYQPGVSLWPIGRKEKDRKAPEAACLGEAGVGGGRRRGLLANNRLWSPTGYQN